MNRSQSQSSAVDGPPSTRRRSQSPSDATHDEESQSTKDARQLEAGVATIELSKSDLNKKATETLKETAQRVEFAKLLNTRSGGMYIPPARLRAMQEAASLDKSSPEYQRLSWDALCKSITGIVNWVNITNIKQIVPELPVFYENLIHVRGLFMSMLRPPICCLHPFCCAPIINTKLPQVGESESRRVGVDEDYWSM